jgi:pyruvate dehydrogenase E1 component alpha subunit
MPATIVDGTDYFAVRAATEEAAERARSGGGPSLIECKAGRFFGHMEGFDTQGYRGEGEVEKLRADADCLVKFAASADLDAGELAAVDATIDAAVDVAVADAKAAPEPEIGALLTDVYVTY